MVLEITLTRVLGLLGQADAPLAPGARVVAKHFWRDRPPDHDRGGALDSDDDLARQFAAGLKASDRSALVAVVATGAASAGVVLVALFLLAGCEVFVDNSARPSLPPLNTHFAHPSS